jgi:hypothetical protein
MEDCLFSDFLGCIPGILPFSTSRAALYKYVRHRVLQSIMHIITTTAFSGNTTPLPHPVLIVVLSRPILFWRSLSAGRVRTLLMPVRGPTCLLVVKVPILGIASSYWIPFCWFRKIDLIIRYRLVLSLAPHRQSSVRELTSKPSTNSSTNFLSKALATAS